MRVSKNHSKQTVKWERNYKDVNEAKTDKTVILFYSIQFNSILLYSNIFLFFLTKTGFNSWIGGFCNNICVYILIYGNIRNGIQSPP